MPWICEEHGHNQPPERCPTCLRETLTSFENMHQEDSRELVRLEAELVKIIDALPKCWRLNKDKLVQDVPVVHGKIVFCQHHTTLEIMQLRVDGINQHGKGRFLLNQFGIAHTRLPKNCYDTREAAEFALKQINQEN